MRYEVEVRITAVSKVLTATTAAVATRMRRLKRPFVPYAVPSGNVSYPQTPRPSRACTRSGSVSPAIVLQVLQKERLPRSDEEAFALTMPLRTTTELQLDQATSCHGLIAKKIPDKYPGKNDRNTG